ncbi:slipin family protein [Eggerthella sinensis]|uniref:slipin family protein n=1 Tax=Eggerthella sinensis TaxID=242230 RepID=UPI0022E61534|nr:slipin family protein [Eggerthella sinensis]
MENYSSPKMRRSDENTSVIFSAFVFVIAAAILMTAMFLAFGHITIWTLLLSLIVAVLLVFTVRIAPQWERDVVLRLGKYNRTAGPGLYFTIPFIEHVSLRVDQRMMLTGFSAEETLTSDLVPVNVDAAVFWMVWDPGKAALEVEDYYDSVSLISQTTLRDAIGRKTITDIIAHRNQLDEELKEAIEEKATPWGVSILFVEIRDIIIPKDLQEAMSAEARADKNRDARISLVEVERDIASMLHDASEIYTNDPIAFKLRQMHLVNESLRESKGSLVVPSSYADGFVEESFEQARKG